jgi:uncharacterized membrane protein
MPEFLPEDGPSCHPESSALAGLAERPNLKPMTTGRIYMDAVLEPPRSLSPRGFNRVMLALGAVNFVVGLSIYLSTGAYPVIGFMGIEVFALWLVFRASFRAQTARTYVCVTADAITVRKVDGRGRERLARLASHFTRVELDPTANGASALRLASSNKAYALGEFLTPKEREAFARRLDLAIAEARRERHDGDNP